MNINYKLNHQGMCMLVDDSNITKLSGKATFDCRLVDFFLTAGFDQP